MPIGPGHGQHAVLVGRVPGCGTVSQRVDTHYERRLLDAAIGGCEVVICLTVSRFLCLAAECVKVRVR
jgi:hypothetical protein